MIDGSEKRNGWLNLELQSLLVIEKPSKFGNNYCYKRDWTHEDLYQQASELCVKLFHIQ